jgi:hypothetical protein
MPNWFKASANAPAGDREHHEETCYKASLLMVLYASQMSRICENTRKIAGDSGN